MKNSTNIDCARTARLATRDEDVTEIRKVFRKSFRPYSTAANRKGRRAARRILKELV